MNIRTQNGSALYIVLIFSVITLATASIYVIGQLNFSKSALKDPSKLQALLNARSGIWYGLALLDRQVDLKKDYTDTADTAMPALFGEDMFDQEESGEEVGSDMSLAPSEKPITISLFDSVVSFTYLLHPSIYFRILESEGRFREDSQKVFATIASQPFSSSDTVLFLSTPGMPEGLGNINGRIAFLSHSIDSSDSLQKKRFYVDMEELRNIVDKYQGPINAMKDSAILNPPLTIQYNDELSQIPDTVYGPLFIDGSSRDLFWKESRKIYVLEELQLTGEVCIEDVNFIVGSDIKVLDNTKLKSVELYTAARIFFAGESTFSGNALACADIEIYENAYITDKSIIISTGFSKRKIKADKENEGDITDVQDIKDAKVKSLKKKVKKKLRPYSLFVRDQAVVDGILVDLRKLGGISTDIETIISGILWAEGRLCHKGRMKGVVKAGVLVDESKPLKVVSNSIAGSIKELKTIDNYYMPYFIGEPAIVEWIEK